MLATLTQAPAWAIEQSEADRLAETFARVARWYDIPDVGEKAADHYGFIMAIGVVYGTRLVAAFRNSGRTNKPGQGAAGTNPVPPAQPAAPSYSPPVRQKHDEPPDPRFGQKMMVEGLGELDIPPLAGGTH